VIPTVRPRFQISFLLLRIFSPSSRSRARWHSRQIRFIGRPSRSLSGNTAGCLLQTSHILTMDSSSSPLFLINFSGGKAISPTPHKHRSPFSVSPLIIPTKPRAIQSTALGDYRHTAQLIGDTEVTFTAADPFTSDMLALGACLTPSLERHNSPANSITLSKIFCIQAQSPDAVSHVTSKCSRAHNLFHRHLGYVSR